jgi:ketosteroid isomerase-like protein
MMAQQNLEAGERLVAAFNRGDVEAALAEMDPGVEFVPMRAPVQGAYHGHAGIREFFTDNAESFDVFHVDHDELRVVGDHVVAIGVLRIRGKGSGAEVTVPTAVVATFHEGKIVRFEEFGDADRAIAAAGLGSKSDR